MTNTTNEIDAIRHQMARIRRRRHRKVSGLLTDAERVVHLGRQLQPYAWAALGAGAATTVWLATGRVAKLRARRAAAGGYLNIPREIASGPPRFSERPGLQRRLSDAWIVIISTVVRAAQNCAAERLESWIASKLRSVAREQAPASSQDALESSTDCVQRPEQELTVDLLPASNGEARIA